MGAIERLGRGTKKGRRRGTENCPKVKNADLLEEEGVGRKTWQLPGMARVLDELRRWAEGGEEGKGGGEVWPGPGEQLVVKGLEE